MTDAAKKKPEPETDLLEFLGDIDEVNDETQDEDFSEFLAKNDIHELKGAGKEEAKTPQKPAKVKPVKVTNE